MQTSNQTSLLKMKIYLLVALIGAVSSRNCSSKPFYEDCKDGGVILTGLFSIHDKTVNGQCDTVLNIQELASAEAMVYAIEQVNKDPYLLPNITLGYRIFDTCGIPSRANTMAFSFVIENTLNERIHGLNGTTQDERVYNDLWPGNILKRPIAAVIGPGDSASSVVVSSMLQVGSLAQISPSSASDELSQPYYQTFFRTVPPDSQQAKAISDIIKYFNWSYIAVIGSDSSYGRYGVGALEHEAHESDTYCIHSIEYFPTSNYEDKIQRIVAKLKKATNVKVIVLWAGGISSIRYLIQESYKQQLFGRTWIAPDGWSHTTSLFTPEYSAVIGGFIGTTFRHFNVSGFEKNLLLMKSSSLRSQDNMWWREFWQTVNNCSQFTWKGCGDKLNNMNEDLLSLMHTTTPAYVIDAVRAAAHAIDSVYRCQHDHHSNLSQVMCLPTNEDDIRSVEVLRALTKIQFQGLTGSIGFNENGDSLRSAAYDIVNLQFIPGGTPTLKIVGAWDRGFKERLQVKSDWLVWKNGSKVVPISGCSESCPPGTKQSPTVACCWECFPCPHASVSASYSSTNCSACEADEKANHDNTKCEALPLDHLSINDGRGIGLAVVAVIGILLTLFTFGVFVKYRDTPVVKTSNQQLSYTFLFSLLVAFCAASILTFGQTPFSCTANMLLSTMYYNVCVSILFLKTSRLLHVFKFKMVVSSTSRWFYNTRYQFAVLGVLNLLPVVLSIALLVVEPPLVKVTIVPLQYKILECNHDTTTAGVAINCTIFAYELILSVLVAYYAFRARKLPSNFNETKYIAFNMYIQLTTWGTTLSIFTSLRPGSFRAILHCIVQLCSAFSFLLCIFAPKLLIILRHPEKNTARFVKAAVTRDTMQRNMTANLSLKRLNSAESTCTTFSNSSVHSMAENDNSNTNRNTRRVMWDSHVTTNEA